MSVPARRTASVVATLAMAAIAISCAESPTAPVKTPDAGCPIGAVAPLGVGEGPALARVQDGCAVRSRIAIPLTAVIDMNDAAQVLGRDATGGWVVWSRAAGKRVLTAPQGASTWQPLDLDKAGRVLGTAMVGGSPQIIVWHPDGEYTAFATPREPAVAWNDNGVVIGGKDGNMVRYSAQAVDRIQATTSKGHSPIARYVTSNDVIVGDYWEYTQRGVFRYDHVGGFKSLFTMPRHEPAVRGANAAGQILTTDAADPTGRDRRVRLWNGTTLNEIPGMSDAVALSETGEVLGIGTVDGAVRILTWTATGGTREIMERSTQSTAPIALNSWGDILGTVGSVPTVWTWAPERW